MMDKVKAGKLGLGALGLTTAIGVGAAFGPSVASAQEAEVDTETESTESQPEKRSGKRRKLGAAKGEVLSELGLEKETIKEGRQQGLTLAEIAEAEGVSEDDLVGAIVSQIESLAQENDRELEKSTEELTEAVTEKVNSVKERSGKFKRGFKNKDSAGNAETSFTA